MVTKGEKGRDKLGAWISRHKVLYITQINNKVLLYSTRNCIHYRTISHNGKESEKEYVYMCIAESFGCAPEANTL